MFSELARIVYRLRWLVIGLWIALAVAAHFLLPNLSTVVTHKSNSYLSESSSVMIAGKWSDKINPKQQSGTSVLIAIHNPNQLTTTDTRYFSKQLRHVEQNKKQYGASSVEDAFNNKAEVAKNFKSKDKTTMIALVGLTGAIGDDRLAGNLDSLKSLFGNPPAGSQVTFTGDAPIQEQNIQISQDGVKKTEGITIILVLSILLIVFRSVVAPLVSLISIGLSFLITSGVVAWAANQGLPISTFTQTFLIAILFGAGTDYSIIILNRFREELTKEHHGTVAEALQEAMGAIGKTVVFSSLTVLVSFAVLYFAKFGLYRSAVGVSIGIAITLAACLTFVPALAAVLGTHLYWPRRPKRGTEHPESKVWRATGGIAIRRPWPVIAVFLVVGVPIALLFTNDRSFDPMADIPQAPAVKGFKVVSQAFGPGKVLPMYLVMHTNDNLLSPEGLATLSRITHVVGSLPYVDQVSSATSPAGSPITQFQLASQDKLLANGLDQVHQGLVTLGKKLNPKGTPSPSSGMQKLVNGATSVANGSQQVASGLSQAASQSSKLESGAKELAQGVGQYTSGVASLASGSQKLTSAAGKLATGAGALAEGVSKLTSGAGQLSQSEQQLATLASQLSNALAQWTKLHPDLANDPNWQQIVGMAQAANAGQAKVSVAGGQLSAGLQQLEQSSKGLHAGASQVQSAAGQLSSGASALANKSSALSKGTSGVASGTTKLVTGLNALAPGANQVASGTKEVAKGLGDANTQIEASVNQSKSGLEAASSAVAKLDKGVVGVRDQLNDAHRYSPKQDPGFYVPQSEMKNASLKQAMDAYISPDGHYAKISIVLKSNPYGTQAIDEVPQILSSARTALKASPIHTGTLLAGGTTPVQAELNRVSNGDFVRTVSLVLAGIFVLLAMMLRSLITPLYVILSLAGTYFVTMGLLQTISLHILNKPGISWVVPFFVFLLLVALGVDYSIFLMSRFEEEYYGGKPIREAMHAAMSKMGNVIFSAAIIMAGTFGSMAAAGVTSLVEIATGVVLGLLIYTALVLGLFVPASAAVVGIGHNWPFGKPKEPSRAEKPTV